MSGGSSVNGHGAAPTRETFTPQVVRLKERDVMDDGNNVERLVGDALLDAKELTEIAGKDGIVQDGDLRKAGFVHPEDRQAILKAIGTRTAQTGYEPLAMRFDGLGRNVHAIETNALLNPMPGMGVVMGGAIAASTFPLFGAGSVGDFVEVEANKVGHLMGNLAHMLTSVHNPDDLHHALETMVKDTMAAFGKDSAIAGVIAGAFEKISHTVSLVIEGTKRNGQVDTERLISLNVAVDGLMAVVAGVDAAKELIQAGGAMLDAIEGKGSAFRAGAEAGQALVSVAMTVLAGMGTASAIGQTGKIMKATTQSPHHMAHAMTHAMKHTAKNGAELTHIAEQAGKFLMMGH